MKTGESGLVFRILGEIEGRGEKGKRRKKKNKSRPTSEKTN